MRVTHALGAQLVALLVAGCYGPTPLSVRQEPPRIEALYDAPYLGLARCAVREYDSIADPMLFARTTGQIREFPDDGYAETIIGAPHTSALAEFRRIGDRRTEVAIYIGLAFGGDELARRMSAVHDDCAAGRRTGRPASRGNDE
jgi:hypothetical protein